MGQNTTNLHRLTRYAESEDQRPKTVKSFEESLWDAANKLRGSVESSEYKHVVFSSAQKAQDYLSRR